VYVTDSGGKLSYSQFRNYADICLEELRYTKRRIRGRNFLYLNLKSKSTEEKAGIM